MRHAFNKIGLGIVARASPQLNIFAVGFPAMIIVGLFVLIFAMNGIGLRMQYLWNLGLNNIRSTILGARKWQRKRRWRRKNRGTDSLQTGKAASEGQVARSPEVTMAACTIIDFSPPLGGGYFAEQLVEILKEALISTEKLYIQT